MTSSETHFKWSFIVMIYFALFPIIFFISSSYWLAHLDAYDMTLSMHSLVLSMVLMLCLLQVSKSACILTTQAIMKLLRSKEAAAAVDIKTWPTILDTGTVAKMEIV